MTPDQALLLFGGLAIGGLVGYVCGRLHGAEAMLARCREVVPNIIGLINGPPRRNPGSIPKPAEWPPAPPMPSE